MPSTRDIRRRIRSVSSTAQITKAMQMVAASKMRKAQEAALAGRPFAALLYRIQRRATTQSIDFAHPLLEVRPVVKRAVILVGADKGLCGALNSNLFRTVARFDPKTTVFITAGRRASQFIARTNRQLVAEFAYGDTPRYSEARAIAALARDLFLKREVDEVQVVATRFVNTLTQVPLCLEFLPRCHYRSQAPGRAVRRRTGQCCGSHVRAQRGSVFSLSPFSLSQHLHISGLVQCQGQRAKRPDGRHEERHR